MDSPNPKSLWSSVHCSSPHPVALTAPPMTIEPTPLDDPHVTGTCATIRSTAAGPVIAEEPVEIQRARSPPLKPHPQRQAVDDQKRIQRVAQNFKYSKEALVTTSAHAKAVVQGIFAEAAQVARSRVKPGETWDPIPWRVSFAEACADLEMALSDFDDNTAMIDSVVRRIQQKLSLMGLFNPYNAACHNYSAFL